MKAHFASFLLTSNETCSSVVAFWHSSIPAAEDLGAQEGQPPGGQRPVLEVHKNCQVELGDSEAQ